MLARSPMLDVPTLLALLRGVNCRDYELYHHGMRVGAFARLIGEVLGETEDACLRLEWAGRFHDIGKLFIPAFLVRKRTKLNVEEYHIVQRHVTLGARFLDAHPETSPLVGAARCHHEHWNGRGYPAHLRRAEIPLAARIVSVADVYDAVTSDRPGGGRSHDQAMEEILTGRGTQFSPEVVDAFRLVADRTLSRMAS